MGVRQRLVTRSSPTQLPCVRSSGVAHLDHLIWPTWVVVLCIIVSLLASWVFERYFFFVVVAVCNVEIAVAISKGCGKGGKTVLSFSHAFHSPSFPRPFLVDLSFSAQRFLLLPNVRRKRKDSVPVSMMWARSVIRSNTALQSRGLGNTVVHSEKGKLVVTMQGAAEIRPPDFRRRTGHPDGSAVRRYRGARLQVF